MKVGPSKGWKPGNSNPGFRVERVAGPPPYEVLCAECSTPMVLHRQVKIETGEVRSMFYGCPHFPRCYCTHSAHRDGKPMGTPANAVTRAARHAAHLAFDQLWKRNGWMTRAAAYRWLAEQFGVEEIHIGGMDLEQAERVQKLAGAKVAELTNERRRIEQRLKEKKKYRAGRSLSDDRKHRAERHDRKLERQLEASLRQLQDSEPPPAPAPEPEEEPPKPVPLWRAQLRRARWRATYALQRVWERGFMSEREALKWLATQVKGKRIERMTMRECELVEMRVARLVQGFIMERKVRRALELKEQAEAERIARVFEPGWDREGAAMLSASLEDERVFSLAEGVRFADEPEGELAFVEVERRARLDLMHSSGFGADWWVNGNRRRKERQEHEDREG